MADPTPYINLAKSDSTEIFPLSDFNANMDKLDNVLAKYGAHLPQDATENRSISQWADIASGWSFGPVEDQTNKLIRRGMWCFIEVFAKRTGANISNPSNGNIGNTLVMTLKEPYRPAEHTPIQTLNQGRMVGGYIDKNGGIYIASLTNTGNHNTNHSVNIGAWYILENAV